MLKIKCVGDLVTADHINLVLWWVAWSGKEHEMSEYQRSGLYEKQDIGLTLKLVYTL